MGWVWKEKQGEKKNVTVGEYGKGGFSRLNK
jgi:hypothetical protein